MFQRIKDLWLELRIYRAFRNKHYAQMAVLIAQRSAEQIGRMERQQGLI